MKELFEGNKAPFKGLHAEKHWDWSIKFPVLRFSFGGGVVQDAADLQSRLGSHLRRYENMTVLFEGSAYLFEFKVVELEQQYRWFRNADG